MTGTGTFATDAQVERMRVQMAIPVMMVGGVIPMSPAEVCHACALEAGLPEIKGYYGCDLRTKEFVVV